MAIAMADVVGCRRHGHGHVYLLTHNLITGLVPKERERDRERERQGPSIVSTGFVVPGYEQCLNGELTGRSLSNYSSDL